MRNKILKILLLILGISFIIYFSKNLPFGPGIHDFDKKLTGNYKLYRMSSNAIFIAPKDGWGDGIAIIPEKVIKINEYENYIIAERQELKRRSPNDTTDTYLIPDESRSNYWILDTENNYTFKNLNIHQLKIKLDSLEIPAQIKLIDVYKY